MFQNKFINELSERWIKSGLEPGDIFLLHSNIYRLLLELKKKNVKDPVDVIIKSFLNIVEKNVTIIVPLFNFDFKKKKFFSINNTPSQMGVLTEIFRNKYSICRTGHPVYSFGIFGKKSYLFENINNYSAYSEESPFGILKTIMEK